MSAYVGKLLTSISSALEFNTATLSGAIDIVVIEDRIGRRHCTPFHVRFGKLQLLKSRGIPVSIELNGQKTKLRMFLGAAGEAYFYNPKLEHHQPLELDVETPEHVTLSDSFASDVQKLDLPVRAATDTLPLTPNLLMESSSDLGSPILEPLKQPVPKEERNTSLFQLPVDSHTPRTPEPPDAEKKADPPPVSEISATDYPFAYISDSEVELTRNERDGTAEVVDEPRSPPLFTSQRKWTSTISQAAPAPHGFPAEPKSASTDVSADNEISDPESSSLFGLPSPARRRLNSVAGLNPECQSVGPSAVPPRGKSSNHGLGQHIDESLIISNSIGDVVGEEDRKLECRSVDSYEADEEALKDLQQQVANVLAGPNSFRAYREEVLKKEGEAVTDKGKCQEGSIAVGVPREEGTASSQAPDENDRLAHDGVISMSLCGSLISQGMQEEQIMELFERHLVSYEEFSRRPTLLHESELLFRVDNRLVEFRVAAPFIFSILAFNQRMDIDALARLTEGEKEDPEAKTEIDFPKSPPTPSRGFRWFGWSSPNVVGEPLLQEEDLHELDSNEIVGSENGNDVNSGSSGAQGEGKQHDQLPVMEGSEGALNPNGHELVQERQISEVGEKSESMTATPGACEKGTQALKDSKSAESEETDSHSDAIQRPSIAFSDLDPEELSLRPTATELMELDLKPGANTIRFVVESSDIELNCRVFLWGHHNKVIISDVDGTITRSDVLGHLLPAVGRDWSHVGVAGLYTQIEKNGYKVLYLTARPIGQASQTRAFLHSVSQGSAKLPNGPVLMSPNRLVESFTREVIRRKPHEFKIAALREVRSLFSPDYNPFHAGFGNRDTDVISYRAVGLIPQRIFVVNPSGELIVMKAKYESAASYSTLQDLVESVFPDISGQGGFEKVKALTENQTYNDWNYWKGTLPEIDFDALLSEE